MPIVRYLFATLVLLCLFGACKKDDLPQNSSKRLQRIAYGDEDSIAYTLFSYDSQNRLIAIRDSNNNNGLMDETSIKYNNEGYPVKLNIYHHNSGFPYSEEDSLIYKNNRLVKILHQSPPNPPCCNGPIANYDAQGRIIDIPGLSFNYNAGGNIAEWQLLEPGDDTMHVYGKATATYNTKKNPYSNLGVPYYFLYDRVMTPMEIPILLSENEIQQLVYVHRNSSTNTYNYSYEYDSDGYIKTIMMNIKEVSNSTNYERNLIAKQEFFYE